MNAMILIIDDEPGTFKLHKVHFAKENYGVEIIPSVDEAIAFFKEPRFTVDCLVIDIMMPPGRALQTAGAVPGKAGYALMDWMLAQQGRILGLAKLANIPIAIYTQTDTSVARTFMEDFARRVEFKVSWNVWAKSDSGARGFVTSFLQWFEAVRRTQP